MMKDQNCYVCTGRLGDILNILPILQMDNEQGKRAALMVAKEFAPILDGVTYLDPVVFDGHWMQVKDAVIQAKDQFSKVLVAQVAGPKKEIMEEAYRAAGLTAIDKKAESFLKDQWRLVGRFQDVRLNRPLVFDARDPKREKALVKSLWPSGKKRLVLLHLGGTTSPHPYRKMLTEYVNCCLLKRIYEVVDITDVKAYRFYDLLGLYEKAYTVIASDSAALHLAQATPETPVVALTQDKPSYWHGSFLRKNWVASIRYHDVDGLSIIRKRILEERVLKARFTIPDGPAWIHAFSLYTGKEEFYEKVWDENWDDIEKKNGWIRFPIDRGAFGRDSVTTFGGSIRHPFVKDVIRAAGFGRNDEDVLILTRPDACLNRKIVEKLKLPMCGARMIKDHQESKGNLHAATDLFAFTFGWWREHQKGFPDLVMGTDHYWHFALSEFIKMHGGSRELDLTYRFPTQPVPVQDEPWREYNSQMATHWLEKHGVQTKIPEAQTQIPMKRINPMAIHPHGYNPSILPAEAGRYLMAYRSHRWGTEKTCMAMAILNEQFEVRTNEWMDLEPNDKSTEDGRLFYHKGAPHIAYVRSNYPYKPMKCDVVYGRLVNTPEGAWTVDFRNKIISPDPQDMEKNWIFFDYEDEIYVIYSCDPKQVTWKVKGDQILKIWQKPAMVWAYGPIRGGTHPIEMDGKLYRLFHSTSYGNPHPVRWRYHIGAMELYPEPPFHGVKISSKPILEGSLTDEVGTNKPFHHKPAVVFPGSWFKQDDKFKLSLGVNDASSYIATLGVEDLNL